MIRRCPAPLTMLVAALALSLGSRPMSTWAAAVTTSTATYTLTSKAGPQPIASRLNTNKEVRVASGNVSR